MANFKNSIRTDNILLIANSTQNTGKLIKITFGFNNQFHTAKYFLPFKTMEWQFFLSSQIVKIHALWITTNEEKTDTHQCHWNEFAHTELRFPYVFVTEKKKVFFIDFFGILFSRSISNGTYL